MATATSLYRVMKFNGNDAYSNAVFRKSDVKGMRSPIVWGQAKPLMTGCSRSEANAHKESLDRKESDKS